ncbi:MAG: HEAT repeat domain-containing protein, partial [Verrucomicrobia bacterium]|nr:HEAT repeat domain-containing protein [Verrucomicrobiota bacterium]
MNADAIHEWFADDDVNLRRAAAEAAGRLGWESTKLVPALIRALKDPNPIVARNAAVAIGKVNPPPKSAVGPLIALLQRKEEKPDIVLRKIAAWALGRMGSAAKRAIPVLKGIETQHFPEAGFTQHEIDALRQNARQAVERITACYEKSRPAVRFVIEPR